MVCGKIVNKKLMIIAGEVSGELHGASLLSELNKIDNSIDVCGIGGDKMKAEGMTLLYHIKDMAFLGLIEVIKHLPFIRKVKKDLLKKVEKENIKTVVLIDYPGFNLNIADKLKKMGVKIIYYISPQIWAWGAKRTVKIKRLVDKMIVVFPFEETLYKKAGVNVEFVGHPLIEKISSYNYMTKEEFFDKFALDKSKEILLLYPGSRKQEVTTIFPEMIEAAEQIASKFDLQPVVGCSSNFDESLFYSLTKKKNFIVIKDHSYDLLKHSYFGIIKSGTSTLEAGMFTLPMIIVYKTSSLTYHILKRLVKVSNIGLVNIVAGKTVVPELIQSDVNSEKIFNAVSSLLTGKESLSEMKNELETIKHKLGEPGASGKAAKIIYSYL